MSEERFLSIEHTLERADEDLTRYVATLNKLEKDVEALRNENADLKAMIKSLAEAAGKVTQLFTVRGAPNLDLGTQTALTQYVELIKDVWTKSQS